MFKVRIRRFEYLAIASTLFILLNEGLSVARTKDTFRIENFVSSTYNYYHSIFQTEQQVILFLGLFGVLSAFFIWLEYRRTAELIFCSVIVSTVGLATFFPEFPRYVSLYREYIFIGFLGVTGLLLLVKKTRRALISLTVRLLINSFKVFMIATLFYAVLIQGAHFTNIIAVYWELLSVSTHGLSPLTDPFAIFYACTIFVLTYLGIFRATIFHISRKKLNLRSKVRNSELPEIGVIIPAYNEESTILKTVLSVLRADGEKEVIVVNDGSKDLTLPKLIEFFELEVVNKPWALNIVGTKPVNQCYQSKKHKNLFVVDKINGGKHDALNVGFQKLNSSIRYVANIDADTLLDTDSLTFLLHEIVSKNASAASDLIIPYTNGKKTLFLPRILKKFQFIEYLNSFHISRGSLALMNNLMIISGAFGMFDKYSLAMVKGYKPCIGEDMFLTLELQKKKCKLLYVPEAIAHTSAPETVKNLRVQRKRWFKGLMDSLLKFKIFLGSRMSLAYLEFLLVEMLTPLLLPFGLVLLFTRPEIIQNPLFILD